MKLCDCGCGRPTAVIERTEARKGRIKGEGYRFVHGHNQRGKTLPPEARNRIRQGTLQSYKNNPELRELRRASALGRKPSEESRKKMSEHCSLRRPEVREKSRLSHLGKKPSDETRKKMSQNSSLRRPEVREKIVRSQTGRKCSEEAKKKIGRASKLNNSMKRPEVAAKNGLVRRGRHISEDQKEKQRQALRGRPCSAETRTKISRAHTLRAKNGRLNAPPKYTKQDVYTKLEQTIRDELVRRGVQYAHNQRVGRFYPDFIIPADLIVECDGVYWHSRSEDAKRSAKRDACFESYGFRVLHLGERRIVEDATLCVDEIMSLLAEGQKAVASFPSERTNAFCC